MSVTCLSQTAPSVSSLNELSVLPCRLRDWQTELAIAEDDSERDTDEMPYPIESVCKEPPMPSDIALEQFDIALVEYADDRPVPEEPEAMAIGPHIAEAVYEYSLREPAMCVW